MVCLTPSGTKYKDITEERLSKANELNNLIGNYKEIIDRYCNGMSVNESILGRALIDMSKYEPKESADIKNAIKKTLNSIQKEFDEL